MKRYLEAEGLKQGDKIVYVNKGGTQAERDEAKDLLGIGRVLTVKWLEETDKLYVVTDEYPRKGFNIDLFEKVPAFREIQMGDVYRDTSLKEWVVTLGSDGEKKLQTKNQEKDIKELVDMTLTRIIV